VGLLAFRQKVPSESALVESIPKKENTLSNAGVREFRREKCPSLESAKDIVHVVVVQFGVSRLQDLAVSFKTQTQAAICDDSLHERKVAPNSRPKFPIASIWRFPEDLLCFICISQKTFDVSSFRLAGRAPARCWSVWPLSGKLWMTCETALWPVAVTVTLLPSDIFAQWDDILVPSILTPATCSMI
jgi:hypothetical protein